MNRFLGLRAASQQKGESKMLRADGIRSFVGRCFVAMAGLSLLTGVARAEDDAGAVYVLSNQVVNNSILVFDRASDGILTFSSSFPTGGAGTGPLAPSGAP